MSLYENLVTSRQIAYNEILKEEREFYKQRRENAQKAKDEEQKLLDEEIDAEIQLLAELDKIRQENGSKI